MLEEALELLKTQDSFAAIEYLSGQSNSVAVTKTYVDIVRHFYWQQKELDNVVAFARAGIQYGLSTSQQKSEADAVLQLRSAAKGLAYDLASFTWPGWDEPGIKIDAEHRAIGLDAAKTNLRLAHDLQKGNLPLTRAYWMLGAQYLANDDLESARTNFDKAIEYAKNAEAIAEEWLAAGFSQLAQLLASPGDAEAISQLATIKVKLANVENGPEFVQQIETAWRVFSQ